MNNSTTNLLEEAVGLESDGVLPPESRRGRVVSVEDCVETSGAFVLHHFIKRSLSPHSTDVIIFLSFAHSFPHYDRILRKMGCNLPLQRANGRFIFLEMLLLECQGRDGEENYRPELLDLYTKIHQAVESSSLPEGNRNTSIMIDDVSLMEVATGGSSREVMDFLHYCCTLTTLYGCSLVTLNHSDIYSSMDGLTPILQMAYISDVVIKAEPLVTGLAKDVHGQLTVLNKGVYVQGSSRNKVRNFHFRIKESNVEYFYPGSRT